MTQSSMAPFKIQKRKQESVSLCTQSIIQQKGKHNVLRTEDGKIPRGYKVGDKTNLKRHWKAKQTALLVVWISQLTGMSRDQFLMTNVFKCWRSGRMGSAAQHRRLNGGFAGASHHQCSQNHIPGHACVPTSPQNVQSRCWMPRIGEFSEKC